MPADRFFHPRLGHSDRVTALTDFEYRVWSQYILSADDFGVMRFSAVTVQADNDALGARKPAQVQRALDRLVSVRLVVPFEHQGRQYVFQPDWQTFQKVEWPRSTIQPKPTTELLALCSDGTAALFEKHPGGVTKRKPKPLGDNSAPILRTVPELSPSLARARPRETAQANGSGSLEERAGRLREELYPDWYAKYRHGARLRLIANSLEFQDAMSLVRVWDDARIEKLARIVLTTDDPWIANTDRGFKIFALKASWADDRLKAWEADRGIA